jgi:heptosyltransferase-1
LLVRLSSLGDVVQSLPVVHDILRVQPDACIDWLTEEAYAPLVRCVDGIQQVHQVAQRRWRKTWWQAGTRARVQAEWRGFLNTLQARSYDAVLDVQGLIKSAWVARKATLAPGGFSASYANSSQQCSYEWPVRWLLQRAIAVPQRIHAVARSRLLVSRALGWPEPLDAPQVAWQFAPPARPLHELAQPQVWLVHGTTRPDNEWPLPDWVALASRLQRQGYEVVLPHSGAQELERARQIMVQADLPARSILPALGLDALAARMAQAHSVVGLDTGLSHLAVALGRRHVQMFSQPRVFRAGPHGWSHQQAVGGAQRPDLETVWQSWQHVSSVSIQPLQAAEVVD